MDKEILVQYSVMVEEVKDIRRRIQALQRDIDKLEMVSDSVLGTRPDGTYGSIRIKGYPMPEFCRKKAALDRYKNLLEQKEAELLELMSQAEEFIQSIPKSELRVMFRLYYIDGLTWYQVAYRMNRMYPNRRLLFTEDSCKQRNKRFFDNL